MGFLKKLFGGLNPPQDQDNGLYFYFRAARSGEVIQVRLNPGSDLSMGDEGNTYYARKHIVGPKRFERLEAEFYFRKKAQMGFQLVNCDVTGGELVEREDYDAYLAEQEA
ncbi:MAG: hypothetical protein K8S97_02985 [Anaerolineae bacterium]|nr:hypothetical protein [Anaerolineae bacterium]